MSVRLCAGIFARERAFSLGKRTLGDNRLKNQNVATQLYGDESMYL